MLIGHFVIVMLSVISNACLQSNEPKFQPNRRCTRLIGEVKNEDLLSADEAGDEEAQNEDGPLNSKRIPKKS